MNNSELKKKVIQLVHENCYRKGFVTSVDILQQLGYLTKKDYELWRSRKVEYLELVCHANLSKLTLVGKVLHSCAKELGLKPSVTVYMQHGKGAKRKLRFSKSGNSAIELRYSTHYVDTKRAAVLQEKKKEQV